MSPIEPEIIIEKPGSTSNTSLIDFIRENVELRKELDDAQAQIMKLRAENARLANERNTIMLRMMATTYPVVSKASRGLSSTKRPSLMDTPANADVEVVIPLVLERSSKRPIEVLDSSSDSESRRASKASRLSCSSSNLNNAIRKSSPRFSEKQNNEVHSRSTNDQNHGNIAGPSSGHSAECVREEDTVYQQNSAQDQPSAPSIEVAHPVNKPLSKKEFMEGLKNPNLKIKIKLAAVRLPEDSIYHRLRALGRPRFEIPQGIMSELIFTTTTRKELSAQFGGSPYTLLQCISPERTAVHGYKRFLCPMLEMNPHAPQVPGAHGLMFRSGDDDDVFGEEGGGGHVRSNKETVLVGIGGGKWLYMGDYELQKSDSLSIEEYLSVPLKVRSDWASKILTAKSGLRARSRLSILLRKQLGRNPTIAEIHAKESAQKKAKKKRKLHRQDDDSDGLNDEVSVVEIKRAYESGEERLNVWVLKCTGYDENFQRSLSKDRTHATSQPIINDI